MMIPFNKPFYTGKEIEYISQSLDLKKLSGDGDFTKKCSEWIVRNITTQKSLLTPSCTAALEMSAILTDIQPGDEIIMPSYTFVSTALAFSMRGATPVFVDIREDTLNIDERLIEEAISKKTKAIVAVHYAGVPCEMDRILSIANTHNLLVIEDAAHGILSRYKNRQLGSIGDLGCFSFHDTKNIICGEGGAILINNSKFFDRAEIIREKGTNRKQFIDGTVDKYTWVDNGSSFLPGEITAAFLLAQLENAIDITSKRIEIWDQYHHSLHDLENQDFIRRPIVPKDCQHNAHMYYILLKNNKVRSDFIHFMKERGISCVFHYIPLHSSPYGEKLSKIKGSLEITDRISSNLVRLPLWPDLGTDVNLVIEGVHDFFKNK